MRLFSFSSNPTSPSEDGASMVEYALLIVLIAIIAIVAVTIAGQSVSTSFDRIADSLANPPN
jgi:pilus assembly protein Flp/PilA